MALRDLDFADGVSSSTPPVTPPGTATEANYRVPASAGVISSEPAVGTSMMEVAGEAEVAAETAADELGASRVRCACR